MTVAAPPARNGAPSSLDLSTQTPTEPSRGAPRSLCFWSAGLSSAEGAGGGWPRPRLAAREGGPGRRRLHALGARAWPRGRLSRGPGGRAADAVGTEHPARLPRRQPRLRAEDSADAGRAEPSATVHRRAHRRLQRRVVAGTHPAPVARGVCEGLDAARDCRRQRAARARARLRRLRVRPERGVRPEGRAERPGSRLSRRDARRKRARRPAAGPRFPSPTRASATCPSGGASRTASRCPPSTAALPRKSKASPAFSCRTSGCTAW